MFSGATIEGVKVYSLADHGPDYPVSDHFRLVEFSCNDGTDIVLIHDALPILLERIRKVTGKPVHINSAYRTPSHNRRIGGVRQSRHTYGYAADITVRDMAASEVATVANRFAPGGLGRYDAFTHIDVWGSQRRWDNRRAA